MGFTLAATGWFKALSGSSNNEDPEAGTSSRVVTADSSASRKDRGTSGPKLMSDPRSIRLISLMEELDGQAESGKPRPAFLEAAELTLGDSLFHRRQRDFRLLMEKMRPEDALAIHERFREMEREGKYFANEYAAFAMRWGQIDGEGAMACWAAREVSDRPYQDLSNVLTGWATTDAEETLRWIEGNKESLLDMNGYRPLLAGWLVADPVAATAWLTNGNFDPMQYAECVEAGVLDKIYSDGVDGASEWLGSLPDGREDLSAAAKRGWNAHIAGLGNLDPALAATTWGKVGSKNWMGPGEFMRFCGAVAHGNEGSLDDFAEQLSKSWPKAEATAQFARWAEQDPATAGMVLTNFPSSPVRDAGIEGLLQSLDQSDPALAETWREQLNK